MATQNVITLNVISKYSHMYSSMNFKKRIILLTTVLLLVFCYQFYILCSEDIFDGDYWDYWWLGKIRDAKHYINETRKPLIFPKKFCRWEIPIVVIITGRHYNLEKRSAIRATWGRPHENVSFYFLMGHSPDLDDDLQMEIKVESSTYGDIIQEHFVDSYQNLTLKSINMLKLFKMYCSKSKYLIKADDDVYLNVPSLVNMLLNETRTDFVLGTLCNHSTPERDPFHRWYVPYEIYPNDTYPPYAQGPTYILSSDVVEKLYQCVLNIPVFHIEDAIITGICTQQLNITPVDDPKIYIYSLSDRSICEQKDFHSVHNYASDDLQRIFYALKEENCSIYMESPQYGPDYEGVPQEWMFYLGEG